MTAQTFVRDLAVLADRLAADAVVDDMLVTLLPGESATFEVRTTAQLSADGLSDRLGPSLGQPAGARLMRD